MSCAGDGAAWSNHPVVTVAFLGPALGRHDGWVTTQGEVLAGLFAAGGDQVLTSSGQISPLRRAIDHAVDLVRWRQHADVAVVSVFSAKAFALADESISLARALGIPTVAWLHGGNLPAFGDAHPRWVRRVLHRTDAVVAPTAFLARWADHVTARTTSSTVIPNVLDLPAYRYRQRSTFEPRLLWMRTFQDLYDPASAVEALALLRSRGIQATLTMAGQDKGLLDGTRALARARGVEGAVTFPGFASGQEKADLLDCHDIFVNTNLVDNAPVTVLEAAASGLAIVSTDAGGIPDLLEDQVSARLVPSAQPEALADAVAGILESPDAAAMRARAARSAAEGSAWPAVHDRWRAVFDTVGVSRQGRPG